MRPARPKLTLAIERWLEAYFDWMDDRWWGFIAHPWMIYILISLLWIDQVRWWIMGVATGLILASMLRRRRECETVRRIESHICLECGYDLRASPERCPECGTPVPTPNLRRLGL